MRELPRRPRGETMIPSSEVMLDPWNDQEMVKGSSPFLTIHETCAKSPSFRTSPPNERGETSGGSAGDEEIRLLGINMERPIS